MPDLFSQALDAFTPTTAKETTSKAQILDLLPLRPACLYRDHLTPGHLTGSGFLFSADGQRVLLNHHKFLDKWLHFGGHADGDADILAVARREVEEESGLSDFDLAYGGILSVDVHPIPENPAKGEAAHNHYDIIYLFKMRDGANETPAISEESAALKWADLNDLSQFSLEKHLQSALDKAIKLLA
tara:strand:- start:14 stop:571 length:558 start_codon:yes stop_codon:yes gene_type:complete